MQYALQESGDGGVVVGIDYKEIRVNSPNFHFIKGDFYDKDNQDKIKEHSPFNGIISDMAPDTEGDRLTDCYRSSELVKEALIFANSYLKNGGFFVAKIFQGGDEMTIFQLMKKGFREVKWFKPNSSRKISFEIFLIGIDFYSKIELGNQSGMIELTIHLSIIKVRCLGKI